MTALNCAGTTVLDGCTAVLFDKDGTLVDIHHYWASMIRLRSALLVEWFAADGPPLVEERIVEAMGVDPGTGRMKRDGPVGVRPRPAIVVISADVLRAMGHEVSDEDVEACFAEVDRRTAADLAPLVRVLPGVEGLLEDLATTGVVSAVVTTDLSVRATGALEVAGLLDRFEVVVGADEVARTKPAPDLAVAAMECLDVDPVRTVVVGDHPVDVDMAVAAGCGAAVGVLTGLADESGFQSKPCVVAPDLTHLMVT